MTIHYDFFVCRPISHIENIELFLEEYGDDARAAKKLRVIESVMKLFQKVANPLSNSKGFGSKLLAIMNTRECGIVFGQLDVSLTVTSVKTSARGSTATLFQASPYDKLKIVLSETQSE